MRARPTVSIVAVLAAAACAGGVPPADVLQDLDRVEQGASARLWLDGAQIVGAAVPVDLREVPLAVRTTFDAIAPGGEVTFVGRETGPRGAGYRLEKRYVDGAAEHSRSVLVDAAGAVLERAHTVAVRDVPQHVLVSALRSGSSIDEAAIVSGPEHEEHWALIVSDRDGRRSVVHTALDGRELRRHRRIAARIDV